jgi:hypothetical protein
LFLAGIARRDAGAPAASSACALSLRVFPGAIAMSAAGST